MKNFIKITLGVSLGLFPMANQSFAQTNTNVGNSSGSGGSGVDNSFFGYAAGQFNTSGSQNTFLGSSSGNLNSTGDKNVFLGWFAGNVNSSGYNNVFLGSKTGKSNTSGFRNTFLGPGAGLFNTTGNNNVLVGYLAGRSNQTGADNVFLGSRAGFTNTGSSNIFIGNGAGYSETGSNKLYIDNSTTQTPLILGDFATNQLTVNGDLDVTGNVQGSSLDLKSTNGIPFSLNEEPVISCNSSKWHFQLWRTCGIGPRPPAPFKVMTFSYSGDNYNVGIGMQSPSYKLDVAGVIRTSQYLISSDKRLKKDIKPIKNAGELLNQLEGVTYDYRQDLPGKDGHLVEGKQIGFIAQEVQKVIPEIVKEDNEGYLSVSYQSLIPLLVENQKELNAQNDELKEANRKLELEIESIKEILSTLTQDLPTRTVQVENSTEAMLLQNAPNPFSESTSIEYNLPAHCAETQLLILNSNGQVIKSIENLEVGRGKIILEANSLAPGTYHYSLVCQGQNLATKSMVIVR